MTARDSPGRALPAGTVTLLFADVEGSTRLLNLLGERFAPARARMRELVRVAAREHDGAEVDWAGDGVFLAFPRARDAVAAAAQIHRSLAAEPWPDDEAHRLRIGLHTGEPELGVEGYVGIDVVIAARICAASHGEQVVVSQATRDVSGDVPLEEGAYRPLGRHRLKDVPGAVQLYQLVGPGLREDFPPLKTLTATSLPALHHRLVGREEALARLEHLLNDQGARLVTITGPGGAGKSRLALEAAAGAAVDRPVHLVGLAPVTDVELVPSAIARALGVREAGSQPVLDAVADRIEGSGALLFLDNLEHLPTAATHVAALLDRAPDLQVLATSRAPLRLSIEHVMPLEPLALEDAATLFVELAAARGVILQADALASVREICRRLDGLPLAIELVAARLAVLPPSEIVRALGQGLALEMEGPVDLPERQRTLRAAIDWSYQRLTGSQQALHAMLAVFPAGAALDDLRALAPQPPTFLADLEALVGWSLVRSEAGDGAVRLSMLETVREHAVDHLRAVGMLDDIRTRHADYFLVLALEAKGALEGPDQARWLRRLDGELDNFIAACDWLVHAERMDDALRALASLERFWRAHGHMAAARSSLAGALTSDPSMSQEIRADALWTLARLAAAQSDWAEAVPALEQAVDLFQSENRGREVAFALAELGAVALRRDDVELARTYCEDALAVARGLDDSRAISGVLTVLVEVYRRQGDHGRALELAAEAVAVRRALDNPILVADATYHLGVAALEADDLERAARAFEDSLALATELGDDMYRAAALCMLGSVELLRGEESRATTSLHDSLDIYVQFDDRRSIAECVCALGGLAAAQGRVEDAARLWGAADALRGEASLEYAEPAIEARFEPEVAGTLGSDRLAALRAEGYRLGFTAVLGRTVDVVAARDAE